MITKTVGLHPPMGTEVETIPVANQAVTCPNEGHCTYQSNTPAIHHRPLNSRSIQAHSKHSTMAMAMVRVTGQRANLLQTGRIRISINLRC